MDITYVPTAKRFVYLAAVIDGFSRRVLAWRVSITMEAAFCVLEEALARHGRPEIFNTDQGSQFAAVQTNRATSPSLLLVSGECRETEPQLARHPFAERARRAMSRQPQSASLNQVFSHADP